MKMPKWNTVFLALWLIPGAGIFFGPSAYTQPATISHQNYVGLIVTRTATEAKAVLDQLRAGMDFGVLAKETPSTQVPAMADI